VVTIEMKRTNVPQPVQPSFDEVNQAIQEKERMKEIIRTEDKSKPYSNQEVAIILKRSNIDIARRTVG